MAVSPGRTDAFGRTRDGCPTFSWGGLRDALEYELVVIAADGEPAGSEPRDGGTAPALRVSMPGAAHSYTPDLGSCVEPGRRYAWLVRARVGAASGTAAGAAEAWTGWSEPAFFEVATAPTINEVEEALAVLRRYTEAADAHQPASAAAREAGANGDRRSEAARSEVTGKRAGIAADGPARGGGSADAASGQGESARRALAGVVPESFAFRTAAGGDVDLGGDLYQSGVLFAHRRGSRNTALGADALAAATTADDNTAVGSFALSSVTSGDDNTAVGSDAADALTTGAFNVAVGNAALTSGTTAHRNIAVGTRALQFNVAGYYNVAVGYGALLSNGAAPADPGDGTRNVGVGTRALYSNTTGHGNTAFGHNGLRSNQVGSYSVAVGAFALDAAVTSSLNTAVGAHALGATTACCNSALGAFALESTTTGHSNTAIGMRALYKNEVGDSNVAIGYKAGRLIDGNDNIAIAHPGVAGESGRIRIGSDSHTQTFIAGIHGVTVSGGIAVIVDGNGHLGTSTSSRRFKEDIRDLGSTSEAILELRPVSFRYTEEAAGSGERPIEYGLIAEEVAEVFPELVAFDDEGRPWTVRYHLLVPLLLNELQEAKREIRALQATVGGREARRTGRKPPRE